MYYYGVLEMGKHICDCGAHYDSLAAIESCQIGNHGQSAAQAVKWQPIATAPKDGTVIIGVYKKEAWVCRWWTKEQIAEDEGGHPDDYNPGWYLHDDSGEDVYPRSWMPWPGEAI